MARSSSSGDRQVLAACSAGGHLKQLASLVGRLPALGEVTWLTHDSGLTQDVLASAGRIDDQLVFAPYAAPRDLTNVARSGLTAHRLLRERDYDLAVSTGAGMAVGVLPMARARGVRTCFIESATRADGPSMSGRILQRIPGIELYTQNPGYGPRWRFAGSVHDGFRRGPDRTVDRIAKVVVVLGTIRPYSFRRLVDRLLTVLPPDADVLWQTGATPVDDLPLDARATVPAGELETAIAESDVVVAHAGTGSALTAFEHGRCPILVPRRHRFDEHVDDHQVSTAAMLASRDLAFHVEADALTPAHLETAARRTVATVTPPPLEL